MFEAWINRRIPPSNAITLKQNQVYIFPSRFGFAYLFFCFVLLLLAINFQNSLVYILCFWLSSLFAISIIQTWLNLARIHIRAGEAQPIFMGERAEFNIVVESLQRAHHAIWLKTKESETVIDCARKHNISTALFVTGIERGRVRLPRFKVETTYPLGIIRAWSYVDLNQAVLCYSKPIENSFPTSITAHTDLDSESDISAKTQGVENFDDLKTYQIGDPLSRISWHGYARGQGLFVKTFVGQESSEIWLNYEDFSGDIELRLAHICYWVLRFHEENRVYGLKVGNELIQPDTGGYHLTACLEVLALYGK